MQQTIPHPYPPLIVGPVASVSALREVVRDSAACDWVEVRVDGLLRELPVEEVAAIRLSAPLLLTVRAADEGGLYDFTDIGQRIQAARRMLPSAVALDWEIQYLESAQELIREARAAGVQIIASAHDFEKTPSVETLMALEQQARSLGADVVKFAFRLQRAEDMSTGLEVLSRRTGPMAVMGMGVLGPVSRLLYAQHGSCLVYGYIGDTPTAPGQWSTRMFRETLDTLAPAH